MNRKYLIVVSEFNSKITQSLLEGAEKTLYKAGLSRDEIDVVWVPGAFELPLIAARGARSSRYQAVICLGCVIRGETPHFDYVCQAAAHGIMEAGLATGKPVIFGVLTTDNGEQALARSGLLSSSPSPADSTAAIKPKVENKGVNAAEAALRMVELLGDWPEK